MVLFDRSHTISYWPSLFLFCRPTVFLRYSEIVVDSERKLEETILISLMERNLLPHCQSSCAHVHYMVVYCCLLFLFCLSWHLLQIVLVMKTAVTQMWWISLYMLMVHS